MHESILSDCSLSLFVNRGCWIFLLALIIYIFVSRYYRFYGDSWKIECPTRSGRMMTLLEVSQEITRRLTKIFTRDNQGRRPCHGDDIRFQTDPYWRDLLLFHEYFHGDNGQGLGASHQTGWTALIIRQIEDMARLREKTRPHWEQIGVGISITGSTLSIQLTSRRFDFLAFMCHFFCEFQNKQASSKTKDSIQSEVWSGVCQGEGVHADVSVL